MDTAVWASLSFAVLGVFVSTRMYRHGYSYPRLEGNLAEVKGSFLRVLGWLGFWILATIVWAIVIISYAPMPGTTVWFGVIGAVAPLVGLILGTKRGKQRLTRS